MKRFLALTLALLIVMTMAACGGSGGKAADPNTLVVWHDKEAAVIEALQAYLDKALPDITVRFEKKTSLTDSLKLVGNDPSSAPDLFVFAHDKIGVFAEMGILTPVTELISQSELSGYLPMTLEAATYNGSLYQLPLYFETLLFMYNRRYMQDEEVPTTTEELLAYMKENTGRGRYGFVEQHSTAYYSAAWIHGFDGSIIDADGTPFPDQQAVKDALEYHLKFVDLMPGETEYSTVNTLFLEGKADATIGGPWMVPSAREANIDLGIASMPTVDKTGRALAPYSGVQGIHVLTFAAQNKTTPSKSCCMHCWIRKWVLCWRKQAAVLRQTAHAMMTAVYVMIHWCRQCALPLKLPFPCPISPKWMLCGQ